MRPIVVAIRNQYNNGYSFSFTEVEKKRRKKLNILFVNWM